MQTLETFERIYIVQGDGSLGDAWQGVDVILQVEALGWVGAGSVFEKMENREK